MKTGPQRARFRFRWDRPLDQLAILRVNVLQVSRARIPIDVEVVSDHLPIHHRALGTGRGEPVVAAGPVLQVSAIKTTPTSSNAPRIIPKKMRMVHSPRGETVSGADATRRGRETFLGARTAIMDTFAEGLTTGCAGC